MKFMRRRRRGWNKHVKRAEEDRLIKITGNEKSLETRNSGRAKLSKKHRDLSEEKQISTYIKEQTEGEEVTAR